MDGGVSSNREKCIEEVSNILHEMYGKNYNLSLNDCKSLYTWKISFFSFLTTLFKVKNWKIRNSLIHGYRIKLKSNFAP